MQTALVTGAASGIGRATAERLAADGWRVYATDVDTERLAALDADCETARLDVTDAAAVESVLDRIEREVGGLDCLVANAGYGQLGPLEDLPPERIERQFDVNVHGTLRTMTAALPLLRERGGTAIALSSTHGRLTTPGWGAYAGSKHALEGLCDTLRMEVADQAVDVVLVEPAWVRTDFETRTDETLSGFDHSEHYARLYDMLAEGSLASGGPLAVTPERVAGRIADIAAADAPSDRYTVGWPGRFVLATRHLPQSVQDRTLQMVVLALSTLYRLRGGRS